MSELIDLGWTPGFQREFEQLDDPALAPARVVVEHRGAFIIVTDAGEQRAELSGRLRHEANDRIALPAVGDWVAVREGIIHHLLPRAGVFVRNSAGARTEAQVIAANVNVAFVVTSANQDFSARRVERYVIASWDAGATPVIIINKVDLCEDPSAFVDELVDVAAGCSIAVISALQRQGLDEVRGHIRPGSTAVLVGSSGVGKSTLVNALLGEQRQATIAIREDDGRGRHATTHRELIPIPDTGGLLIDTPGMREFALWSDSDGVAAAFDDIGTLAEQCRFRDCSHSGEPGCAVDKTVDPARLDSYFKLQREEAHLSRRKDALARHEERRRGKAFAAMVRGRLRLSHKQD